MSEKITVSKATYKKVLQCKDILKTKSINMTIVELALFFLQKIKEIDKK